jgi:hypothetical protein
MGVSGMGVSGMGVSGMGVSGMGVSGMGVSGMGVSGMGVSGVACQNFHIFLLQLEQMFGIIFPGTTQRATILNILKWRDLPCGGLAMWMPGIVPTTLE